MKDNVKVKESITFIKNNIELELVDNQLQPIDCSNIEGQVKVKNNNTKSKSTQ